MSAPSGPHSAGDARGRNRHRVSAIARREPRADEDAHLRRLTWRRDENRVAGIDTGVTDRADQVGNVRCHRIDASGGGGDRRRARAKLCGLWVERTQGENTHVIYAVSDEPMSEEEWERRYVRPG